MTPSWHRAVCSPMIFRDILSAPKQTGRFQEMHGELHLSAMQSAEGHGPLFCSLGAGLACQDASLPSVNYDFSMDVPSVLIVNAP